MLSISTSYGGISGVMIVCSRMAHSASSGFEDAALGHVDFRLYQIGPAAEFPHRSVSISITYLLHTYHQSTAVSSFYGCFRGF